MDDRGRSTWPLYTVGGEDEAPLTQTRALSVPGNPSPSTVLPRRRGSHDEPTLSRFFKVWVKDTLQSLLDQEDPDGDTQITVEDHGPKVMRIGTATSDGFRKREVRGTYPLANLLEQLYVTKDDNRSVVSIDVAQLNENPVDRTSRKMRDICWETLTRRLDGSLIEVAAPDPKDWTEEPRPRIYVPSEEQEQYQYYCKIAAERPKLNLDVQILPDVEISQEFVHSIRDKPGLLALAMRKLNETEPGEIPELEGSAFVVPGGRFNEFYYWDSYFCCLGLLEGGRTDLVKQIVQNFVFEIQHYGKIPNANRSYYLCRSQPPFLTDLAIRTFESIKHEEGAEEFLKTAISAGIKEYNQVWMAEPRYDPKSGLSRYRPPGLGIPLEVEAGHFDYVLSEYAQKHGISISEFAAKYNSGLLEEPSLDQFLLHDRAVRESGHDTSYRFGDCAADLATIDLNSLLYKYETDICWAIRNVFNDELLVTSPWLSPGQTAGYVETSAAWDRRAKARKESVDRFLWNADVGMYFDYNTNTCQQSDYECATTFYALWSGLASPEQAAALVSEALPKFERVGGLTVSTEKSRGPIGPDRPQRQWDYPHGWAPHQILAWEGLRRYGYVREMERLVYRWLHLLIRTIMDYNGTIAEKYDVTQLENSRRADAEYGNQGVAFKGIAREGFGWTNASFSYGLALLKENPLMRRALGVCVPYEALESKMGQGTSQGQ